MLKHRGTCKDACLSSRSYALSQRPKIKFVPRCREDGSYSPIQCLENNGCWCVNSQGKPIQKTHTKHGKPNCAGKGNQKRSSPNNNNTPRKRCSPNDRVAFNTALLNIFHAEHSKSRLGVTMGDHQVVEWKFKLLDVNKNNILEKSEYQGLKKIAKTVSHVSVYILIIFNFFACVFQVVKPKRCGRRFGKYCDTNKDLNISREEFHHCLSKDLQRRK
jgi:SPARC-related modular calcium-binding protein